MSAYGSTGASACGTTCPVNTGIPFTGSQQCLPCPPGYINDGTSLTCTACTCVYSLLSGAGANHDGDSHFLVASTVRGTPYSCDSSNLQCCGVGALAAVVVTDEHRELGTCNSRLIFSNVVSLDPSRLCESLNWCLIGHIHSVLVLSWGGRLSAAGPPRCVCGLSFGCHSHEYPAFATLSRLHSHAILELSGSC